MSYIYELPSQDLFKFLNSLTWQASHGLQACSNIHMEIKGHINQCRGRFFIRAVIAYHLEGNFLRLDGRGAAEILLRLIRLAVMCFSDLK